jgi:ubiquinone/menaquinone biosynthesis C-methylase UbiE
MMFCGEEPEEVIVREVGRILKPRGRFAIVEFKKISDEYGPPLGVRLAPEEVETLLAPFGFMTGPATDVGPYRYLMTARLPSYS